MTTMMRWMPYSLKATMTAEAMGSCLRWVGLKRSKAWALLTRIHFFAV